MLKIPQSVRDEIKNIRQLHEAGLGADEMIDDIRSVRESSTRAGLYCSVFLKGADLTVHGHPVKPPNDYLTEQDVRRVVSYAYMTCDLLEALVQNQEKLSTEDQSPAQE